MNIGAALWIFTGLLLSCNISVVSGSHHNLLQPSLCLVLPPAVRLGLGQEKALRNECERVGKGIFAWEPKVSKGYEVATKVFEAIANEDRSSSRMTMWFPSVKDKSVVEAITSVVQDNCDRLGLDAVKASSWPDAPATMIYISWTTDCAEVISKDNEFESRVKAAIVDTERWVDDTLCRLALCPYTASLQRAAIGLETAGVTEGPVIVRHSYAASFNACRAASLAASFWRGVSELANEPEGEVATLLVIGPEPYDSDFVSFAAVCDELIEPSVQAVGATDVIGRAWFHPLYRAASIGHSTILPGHALPAAMVKGFVNKYNGGDSTPSSETIAHANDAVRWTPHATINLLRRSQLTAAKTVEAAAANSKPNAVYARNALRIIDDATS